jgi:hypothetical protein
MEGIEKRLVNLGIGGTAATSVAGIKSPAIGAIRIAVAVRDDAAGGFTQLIEAHFANYVGHVSLLFVREEDILVKAANDRRDADHEAKPVVESTI